MRQFAPGPNARQRPRRGARLAVALVASALALTACITPAAPSPSPDPSLPCKGGYQIITFLGDSYTNGTDNDSGEQARFPALLAKELPAQARLLASNGSGYVALGPAPGAMTYVDQARHVSVDSALVVIYGSRNDMLHIKPGGAITEAALTTFSAARDRAPHAPILVIGPSWINRLPSVQILATRDEVKAAVDTTDVQDLHWVDPIEEGWFAERANETPDGRSTYIAADRIHPTDEGHAYLAEKMRPFVEPLVCGS